MSEVKAKYDDRTLRGWPLPHWLNKLYVDSQRLRETITAIDAAVTQIEDINSGLGTHQDSLEARLDVIAGQTTEDTEILDARVDAENSTHPNLGHHIRYIHSLIFSLEGAISDGIAEYQSLLEQFNKLAQAQLQGELNTRDFREASRSEVQHEAQVRQEKDEGLRTEFQEALSTEETERRSDDEAQQEQLDALALSGLNNSLNIIQEAQLRQAAIAAEEAERKETDTEIHGEIEREKSLREQQDDILQAQADELSTADIQQSLNLSRENEQRRKELSAEADTREQQDDELQRQITAASAASLKHLVITQSEIEKRREALKLIHRNFSEQTELNEYYQSELETLIDTMLKGTLNFHDALERRRDALAQETQERSEQTQSLQSQIQKLSEANIQQALSIQSTQEHSRILDYEVQGQREADSSLQEQLDEISETSIQRAKVFCDALERRRDALDIEEHSRIEEDARQQAQIDTNAATNLKLAVNLSSEAEKRRALGQAIAGLKSPVDWSRSDSLAIPEPRCAVVNFTGLTSMPTSKTADLPAVMEFWDMQGNYFKKNVLCSAQGNSSMAYPKKNVKFDLLNEDGSEFNLKIGNWVEQDGFHLKAYYTDFFRGVGAVSYKLWNEIMETKPHKKALVDVDSMTPTATGSGNVSDLNLQIDTGALCHPDGFPCIVYLNGEFYGVFSWQIKKQRKNYHMDKSTVEHIHLDGTLYTEYFWGGNINWTVFEIRNPNKLYTMDGKKYDGDAPRELIDETSEKYDPDNKDHVRSATVKRYIQDFVRRYREFAAAPTRRKYDEIFDWENMRDYLIFSDIVKNSDGFGKNWQWTTYDGVKWYVNAYDLDMSFGGHWQGIQITPPLTGHISSLFYTTSFYGAELEARYKELRDAGIIDVDHIIAKLEDWTARIGVGNYELEYERWPRSPCILNYNDSVDRVRKWLTIEIANMDNVYHYVPSDEMHSREILDVLDEKVSQLRQENSQEQQTRHDDDTSIQSQVNKLAEAVLYILASKSEVRADLDKLIQYIEELPTRPATDDEFDEMLDALYNP